MPPEKFSSNSTAGGEAAGREPLRPAADLRVEKVIVVGASTGGPQALEVVLKGLGPALQHAPVFVVLHIPAEFTGVVADHIERATGVPTRVANHGETIVKGRIYFSPGGVHLSLVRIGDIAIVALSDDPPQNFCKPSVDVLFQSAAKCFGGGVTGVVLTGMGNDGLAGSRAIVDAGGKIFAQDAASSVVWGMPGAVVNNGLAHAVLPVHRIATGVCALFDIQRLPYEKI